MFTAIKLLQHKEINFPIRCLCFVSVADKEINGYVWTVESVDGPQLLSPTLFREGRGLFALEGCFNRNQSWQNYTGFNTKMCVRRCQIMHA